MMLPSLLALRLEALSKHPEAFAADIDKTAAAGENAWVERIIENANIRFRLYHYRLYC